MTNDITQAQNLVSQFVRGMIRTGMLMFGSIFFLFRLNTRFGVIVLCALPLIVGCLALCLSKANPLFSRLQAQLDRINAIMQEDISGIRIIKACIREGYEKLRFGKANGDLIRTQLQVLTILAFMNPVINALIYIVVMFYTTMSHVAFWNVAQQIYTLFLMPIVGITQGVQTIIAYFDGQQEEDKRKKTLVSTIGYTVLYGLMGVVLIYAFGAKILSVFSNASDVYQLGKEVLRIIFLTFPLMGIFYTIMTLYEVTGHEGKAAFLILMRQVILMIPLVFLLPKIMPEYPLAIFCSVPIADIIAMITAVLSKKNKRFTVK